MEDEFIESLVAERRSAGEPRRGDEALGAR